MKLIVYDVVSVLGIHPLASNLMILKNCGYFFLKIKIVDIVYDKKTEDIILSYKVKYMVR